MKKSGVRCARWANELDQRGGRGGGESGQGCRDSSDQEPSIPHFGATAPRTIKNLNRATSDLLTINKSITETFQMEISLCEVLINLKSGYGKRIDAIFIDCPFSNLLCNRCWDRSVERWLEFRTEVLREVLINLKSCFGKHIDSTFIDVIFIDGSYSSLICGYYLDRLAERGLEFRTEGPKLGNRRQILGMMPSLSMVHIQVRFALAAWNRVGIRTESLLGTGWWRQDWKSELMVQSLAIEDKH
ncbi:hypothetical protein CDAR_410991 [Caerostris darwini]|uniref:Uncharacterized protein n=1 Tax=Caerostris darwini TaxID=1538125 RepID=A0AAV4SFM9_9ARAC|nr:hypothetical protein CDAR_410991 [Caerostris darwini]